MPRNMDLYWFMPALAKRRLGSECGTTEDDGTVGKVSLNIKVHSLQGMVYQMYAHSFQRIL